jgi:hypothetical protein
VKGTPYSYDERIVKGLYQTESYSLRILSTEEYFYFPHLVMWSRYCACEILIANPIDQWTNDGSKVSVCSALKMRSVMCISYCLHD